jgi:hypothetical protein
MEAPYPSEMLRFTHQNKQSRNTEDRYLVDTFTFELAESSM